jgi:hypothetical protein
MDGIHSIADCGLRIADCRPAAKPSSTVPSAPSRGVDRADGEKKQIARDFESVLLTKLFDQVQESMGDWGLEEEDGAAPQVQGLFWLYLARDVADKGGVGLWKDIYQYFTQIESIGGAGEAIDEEL